MTDIFGRNVRSALLTASAIISIPFAAEAQASKADDASQLSEVVVTAQRRSERLQDVPVSVTALSGEALEEQKVQTASDLANVVPNLQTVGTVGSETPIFALRGVSMSDFSLNQASPVATYFDEVYKGNFALLGVSLFDLDRVEVLRGPQGTLYGKNTTGGAVNLIARAPGFDPGGQFSVGYGSNDRFEASGAAQTASGDRLAVRGAFTFARADGWFKNRAPGQRDLEGVDQYGLRLSLLARPTDSAEFVLRLSTSEQTTTNYGVLAQPGPSGIGGGVYALFHAIDPVLNPRTDDFRVGLGERELTSDFTPRRRNRTRAAALISTFELSDDLSLISVTSWDEGKLLVEEDTDGSALRALSILYQDRASQVTEDIRLSTAGRGPLNFTVGAFYGREQVFNATTLQVYQDIDFNLDGRLDALDCVAAGPPAGCQTRNSFHQRKQSWAAYGDGSLALGERVKLRAGLRYSHDTGRQYGIKSQVLGSDDVLLANLIPGDPVNLDATTSRRFKKGNVSGKIGLDYSVGGNLYYLSYSRGYRASSFSAQAFFDPSELTIARPETVDSVEAGFKVQAWDQRLRLNGAVFYYRYQDQQFIDVNPDGTQRLLNLPRSRILGAELELAARPVRAVTLTLGLGLLNSRIEEGVVQGVSVRGNRLANAPEVSLSYGIDWDVIEGPWGRVSTYLGGAYVSSQEYDTLNNPELHQGGYNVIGGQIAFRTPDDRIGLTAWGKNLTDETYFTSRIAISAFGFNYNHLGPPRAYGVALDYRF